jgi:secreted PhoX family phosphatase
MDRRAFLRRTAVAGGSLFLGPLHALGARAAAGRAAQRVSGYGPLVLKGDLFLPAEFNYQVLSVQGRPMSDGQITPGVFDGMGAFPGSRGRTILIRNHENRERAGEIKVVTGPGNEYDPLAFGGNTKLEVRRTRAERDPITGQRLYAYEVVRDFAVLGGTSTNCAGGVVGRSWVAGEEVVKRLGSIKHGYTFEIPADANGPVRAIPIIGAGRFSHEAVAWSGGILYETEDRSIVPDPRLGEIGAVFHRYIPDNFRDDDGDDDGDDRPDDEGSGEKGDEDEDRRRVRRLADTRGRLQALKLRDEFHANMDRERVVGQPLEVEWVDVPEPDHDDDTDNRRDRVPGFTPTRIQAQDLGAAYFDRQEGTWVEPRGFHDDDDDDKRRAPKVFFDCTTGGALNLGQVWEYDPNRETITLVYESVDPIRLQNPDNVVIVPQTGDIFLQEDGPSADGQYVRGLTRDGEIYDFCRSATNDSEFCGGCFDPAGHTLYLNQQGQRGDLPEGPPNARAVTYAIYGPFDRRSRHG